MLFCPFTITDAYRKNPSAAERSFSQLPLETQTILLIFYLLYRFFRGAVNLQFQDDSVKLSVIFGIKDKIHISNSGLIFSLNVVLVSG